LVSDEALKPIVADLLVLSMGQGQFYNPADNDAGHKARILAICDQLRKCTDIAHAKRTVTTILETEAFFPVPAVVVKYREQTFREPELKPLSERWETYSDDDDPLPPLPTWENKRDRGAALMRISDVVAKTDVE
jgi:hypothetical protein